MSSRGNIDPNYIFPRVLGNGNTTGSFVSKTGLQQSLTGDNGVINTNVYHTKVYTTNKSITLNMGLGRQDGQTKLITFTFKGNENANIEINCPAIVGEYSRIVLENIGDQVQLVWTNNVWFPLVTLNIMNPSLNTPVIS